MVKFYGCAFYSNSENENLKIKYKDCDFSVNEQEMKIRLFAERLQKLLKIQADEFDYG